MIKRCNVSPMDYQLLELEFGKGADGSFKVIETYIVDNSTTGCYRPHNPHVGSW